MTPLIIVGIGFAFLMILGAGAALIAGGRTNVEERLDQFVGTSTFEVELDVPDSSPDREDVRDRLDKALEGRNFSGRIRERLMRADLRIRVTEYIVIWLLAIAGGALLFYVFFRGNIWLVPIGAFVGSQTPRFFVKQMAARRLRAFDGQLGDTINLWVNSLRSGYSVLQAMESIATEMPVPVSREFERVVQEVRLGLGLDQALENMLRRVPSEDLDLIVTAVNIQREVGGNLAEILDIISHTIRERVRIKREIRTLTAQVRLSAYVVAALPFGMAVILWLINPDYIMQMTEKKAPFIWPNVIPCGWLLIAVGTIMMGIGAVVISKVVDIEV